MPENSKSAWRYSKGGLQIVPPTYPFEGTDAYVTDLTSRKRVFRYNPTIWTLDLPIAVHRRSSCVDLHWDLTRFRCLVASKNDPYGHYLMVTYAEFLTILPGQFSLQIPGQYSAQINSRSSHCICASALPRYSAPTSNDVSCRGRSQSLPNAGCSSSCDCTGCFERQQTTLVSSASCCQFSCESSPQCRRRLPQVKAYRQNRVRSRCTPHTKAGMKDQYCPTKSFSLARARYLSNNKQTMPVRSSATGQFYPTHKSIQMARVLSSRPSPSS